MSSEAQDPRFAPPRAHVEDVEAGSEGLQLATRWSRLAAMIVDLIVAFAAMWVVSAVTPWNPWADRDAGWWTPHVIDTVLGFVLFMAVNGYLLATRGQTLGKAALKIRIARPGGEPASIGRVVGLRYGIGSVLNIVPAVGQVFGLVDALLIFRSSRRCLHDSIADTVVLKA